MGDYPKGDLQVEASSVKLNVTTVTEKSKLTNKSNLQDEDNELTPLLYTLYRRRVTTLVRHICPTAEKRTARDETQSS